MLQIDWRGDKATGCTVYYPSGTIDPEDIPAIYGGTDSCGQRDG